jgi:hypothetical protein
MPIVVPLESAAVPTQLPFTVGADVGVLAVGEGLDTEAEGLPLQPIEARATMSAADPNRFFI